MSPIARLYFSAGGRISRRTWWIGNIIIFVVIWAFTLILANLFKISPSMFFDASQPASIQQTEAMLSLLVWLIFSIPIFMLGAKRRHDRNRSGIDFGIYLILAFLFNLGKALGVEPLVHAPSASSTQALIFTVFSLVFSVFGIYVFVVVGILPAIDKDNGYDTEPAQDGALREFR